MIKGIAFDFDHTLYDRDATYEKMLEGFMTYFAPYLREGIAREEVLQTIQRCDRTGIYKDAHWEGIYRDTLASGIFARHPTYEVYYEGYLENNYPQNIVLYKDTLSTLAQLRDMRLKVGILTNGPSQYQRDKVERVALHRHVDTVVVGGELPHPKPHASAFAEVCRQLGCAVEECAYVGDHPVNDVDGARQAGMTGIWFRSVGTWMEGIDPAPYAVDALGELPALIERINKEQ